LNRSLLDLFAQRLFFHKIFKKRKKIIPEENFVSKRGFSGNLKFEKLSEYAFFIII